MHDDSLINQTLVGDRVVVRLARPNDARGIQSLLCRNREFFEKTMPSRPPEMYTADYWLRRLPEIYREAQQGVSFYFVILGEGDEVMGTVNLFGVVHGSFHAGTVGYSLDQARNGRGLMTEALRLVIAFAFDRLHLHRLMANYRPENERSGRLLERLGFEIYGYSRDYLLVGGQWVDHHNACLVNSNWGKTGAHDQG